MNLKALIGKLDLEVKTVNVDLDRTVTGGYVGDLLSDVMANAEGGNIWVTQQIHQNIVAVAVLKELSGIIIVNKRVPEQEVIEKAEVEKMPMLLTNMSAFEVTGRLFSLGIKGKICA